MLILVGLGNPEAKYQGNRHNLGFRAVETIADRWSFGRPASASRARRARGTSPPPAARCAP